MSRLETLMDNSGGVQASVPVRERTANYSRFFTLALFALFIVMLMIALLACVSVYKTLSASGAAADSERLSKSLLANVVRANDAADAVSIIQGPEGKALVLTERLDSGNYETRIYLYEGAVMQEYVVEGSDFTPASGIKVIESKTFDVDYSNSLITINTDGGTVKVATRSGGVG